MRVRHGPALGQDASGAVDGFDVGFDHQVIDGSRERRCAGAAEVGWDVDGDVHQAGAHDLSPPCCRRREGRLLARRQGSVEPHRDVVGVRGGCSDLDGDRRTGHGGGAVRDLQAYRMSARSVERGGADRGAGAGGDRDLERAVVVQVQTAGERRVVGIGDGPGERDRDRSRSRRQRGAERVDHRCAIGRRLWRARRNDQGEHAHHRDPRPLPEPTRRAACRHRSSSHSEPPHTIERLGRRRPDRGGQTGPETCRRLKCS